MSRNETVTYHCDKCGKKLDTSGNTMDIVTSLYETMCWSRLHVTIIHRHGMHNDWQADKADLCQKCAIDLLTDALKRVKSGERATKGTQDSEQKDWE
jgi:uncharacterized protein YlaI